MVFPLARFCDVTVLNKTDVFVQLDLDIKIDWLKRSAALKGVSVPVV
jgi:hypothetical protein